jgi:hypothetical protein
MDIGGLANFSNKPQNQSQARAEQSAMFGAIFNQKAAEVQQSQRVTQAEELRKQALRVRKDMIETGSNMNEEDVLEDLFDQKLKRLKNTANRLSAQQHLIMRQKTDG